MSAKYSDVGNHFFKITLGDTATWFHLADTKLEI